MNVAEILGEVTKPGPEAVVALGKLCNVPDQHWGRMLPMVFATGPNRSGWQLLLHQLWRANSAAVVCAAGNDRAVLGSWFALADFANVSLPFLRQHVCTDRKPAERMFRGGQGSAEELAGGFSWTPSRTEVVHYAYRRIIRPGPSVIIARTIRAGEIAMKLRGATSETVVTTPGAYTVVTMPPKEVAARAALIERQHAKATQENMRMLSMTETQKLRLLLDGWNGDA